MDGKTQHPTIAVIGLGPVGLVSALCFAKQGICVMGVDIDTARVDALHQGKVPFKEPGIDALLTEAQNASRFSATTDIIAAVQASSIIMLAVGTPTPPSGKPDLSYVEKAARSIGQALKNHSAEEPPIIVIRSTVPPGTMRQQVAPVIEQSSGLICGHGFHIASNPEFLREGKAIHDFYEPARMVIGADTPQVSARIAALYKGVDAPCLDVSVEAAEYAKYVDNSWHAVKVAYANEVGRVAQACGIDPDEMADIFLSDTKLNHSPRYMRPGAPFGGSCLPKDVRGLQALAEEHAVALPLTNAILKSNDTHLDFFMQHIMAHQPKTVGLLGLAFKPNIDDLRESPYAALAQQLSDKGITVIVHDPAFADGRTIAINALSVANHPLETIAGHSDVIVLCHASDTLTAYAEQCQKAGHSVVDMTALRAAHPVPHTKQDAA